MWRLTVRLQLLRIDVSINPEEEPPVPTPIGFTDTEVVESTAR